jgi:hypothetical protein
VAIKKAAVLSILVAFMLLRVAVTAKTQQLNKIPRIGFLSGGSLMTNPVRIEVFRDGRRSLGYGRLAILKGKNIVIEWRFAKGNPGRYPALAASGLAEDARG